MIMRGPYHRPYQWLFLGLGIVAGCSPGYFFSPTGAQAADSKERQQGAQMATQASSIFDFTLNDIDGKLVSLS
ncbi:MAG: hypothetical protein M3Z35_03495, partial [Nitrospirota bacterium]|nr:hypothetical protein [Nitrospirota bacterium]